MSSIVHDNKNVIHQHPQLKTGVDASPLCNAEERKNASKGRRARLQPKFCLAVLFAFVSLTATAQTFNTIADGNWSSPSTWSGGLVPTGNITAGIVVNVNHDVTCDLASDIFVAGKLNIVGDTLRFPAIFSYKTTIAATGQLVVRYGGYLQDLAAKKSVLVVDGGYLKFENARVDIGKTFEALNGGKRFISRSVVTSGDSYLAKGSSTSIVRDTIQSSTVSAGASDGGHWELTYAQLNVANVKAYVGKGNFKVDATSGVSLLAGIANYYGFNILSVEKDLSVDGQWDARIDAYCVIGSIVGTQAAQIDFVRPEDCTLTPSPVTSGQLVINEVYTDPGVGKHEFIELYNISTQPESVNNYTLITYFDTYVSGVQQRGFYVLDFPDFTVPPKSLFVGAAALPFSFQALSNTMKANFTWNSLLSGSNGSLQKWVLSNDNNESDGNRFYNNSPLSLLGLNDLFFRLSGDNSYTFFLYKNGILVNQIIAGAGGSPSISSSITSMPPLNVDMTGSSPDFTVVFSTYKGMPVEKINQDAGSDNGFIRKIDGGCGSWKKSSSSSTHTPLEHNGPIVSGTGGDVYITSSIVRGTETTGSTLNYKVVSASENSFVVELRVFLDNGILPGEYDLSDVLLETRSAFTAGESFTTVFKPFNSNILILVKQGSGCVDHIAMVKQPGISTLPLIFHSFAVLHDGADANLTWSVNESEGFSHFVVQRSTNGVDFTDVETVLSGGSSFSTYNRKDKMIAGTSETYYYRIKGVDKSGAVLYSQTRMIVLNGENPDSKIRVYPNPVKEELTVVFPLGWRGKDIKLEVMTINGNVVSKDHFGAAGRTKTINIGFLPKGFYILKVRSGQEVLHQQIIKN